MIKKINKKGQIGLEDAPSIILIVGLLFLVMATIAFIGEKFGDALDEDDSADVAVNESVLKPTDAGVYLAANSLEDGACGTITAVYNNTGGYPILVGNYTQTDCKVVNATPVDDTESSWLFSYPYTYSKPTVSSNVTDDLNTEIGNNTSIAGIVLTISLIGIVLTILVGVFFGLRAGTTRV